MYPVYISGVGARLGSEEFTIEEIVKGIPKDDGTEMTDDEIRRLKRRSGINRVYGFLESENLREILLDAARMAVRASGISEEAISRTVSGIYFSASSAAPDYDMPSPGRILGQDLGAIEFRTMPMGVGCVGGLDAILHTFLQLQMDSENGKDSYYLAGCGDNTFRALNPKDRETKILFSEGACLFGMSNKRPENGYEVSRIESICLPGDVFCMSLKNRRAPLSVHDLKPGELSKDILSQEYGFKMNGEAVYEFAVKSALPRLVSLLELNKLSPTYYVCPHQGSMKILKWIPEIFKIPKENVYSEDISEIGNMTGASFMFALYNSLRKSYIKPEQVAVPIAFGVDLKVGGAILSPIGDSRKIV